MTTGHTVTHTPALTLLLLSRITCFASYGNNDLLIEFLKCVCGLNCGRSVILDLTLCCLCPLVFVYVTLFVRFSRLNTIYKFIMGFREITSEKRFSSVSSSLFLWLSMDICELQFCQIRYCIFSRVDVGW